MIDDAPLPPKPLAQKPEASAKTALRTLIGALEGAAEGSRELDGDFVEALRLAPARMKRAGRDRWQGIGKIWHAPFFTTNVDAVAPLAAGGFILESTPPNKPTVELLTVAKGYRHPAYRAYGATCALALCIAIVKTHVAESAS